MTMSQAVGLAKLQEDKYLDLKGLPKFSSASSAIAQPSKPITIPHKYHQTSLITKSLPLKQLTSSELQSRGQGGGGGEGGGKGWGAVGENDCATIVMKYIIWGISVVPNFFC